MERELMPDYEAEKFYQYLIPKSTFEGSKKIKKEDRPRFVLCKKGFSGLPKGKDRERAFAETRWI